MDDESLEAEIASSPDVDDAATAAAVEPAPSARRARKKESGSKLPAWLRIGGVFVLLGVGVATLLWGTEASDVFVYSKLVDEVMSEPDRYQGREIRVEGQLQRGSVEFVSEPNCEHTFVLTRGGFNLPVRFPRCVVPDTFRDDMPMDVVVQGQLQANNTFLANEVIPRCPSKYEMQQRQQNGEEMPHSMPGETS
ncbi:MAG: cytochrome c maturation protein CcmE [Sandaracinaceae bacterium]